MGGEKRKRGRPKVVEDGSAVSLWIGAEDLAQLLELIERDQVTMTFLLRAIVRGYLEEHGPRRDPARGGASRGPWVGRIGSAPSS